MYIQIKCITMNIAEKYTSQFSFGEGLVYVVLSVCHDVDWTSSNIQGPIYSSHLTCLEMVVPRGTKQS